MATTIKGKPLTLGDIMQGMLAESDDQTFYHVLDGGARINVAIGEVFLCFFDENLVGTLNRHTKEALILEEEQSKGLERSIQSLGWGITISVTTHASTIRDKITEWLLEELRTAPRNP